MRRHRDRPGTQMAFKGHGEIPPTTSKIALITDQLIKTRMLRASYNDPARLVWIGVPLIRTGEGVTARNATPGKNSSVSVKRKPNS
ncbi:MAG: hypothetical protein ACLR8Y_18360 [Alistipes indistinctus]